jgi:hypothetical protein
VGVLTFGDGVLPSGDKLNPFATSRCCTEAILVVVGVIIGALMLIGIGAGLASNTTRTHFDSPSPPTNSPSISQRRCCRVVTVTFATQCEAAPSPRPPTKGSVKQTGTMVPVSDVASATLSQRDSAKASAGGPT